ncbi:hypothetical protein C8U37_10840 [Trichococcus patagoniensis]|uniref:Uncharacterized protein n=1 Tax=Trichococcus patagoniensis TaxID=382641 RepID=A0A2T5IKZ3_9LACT|nr:hypothetical protein C8U37_10840 [Trichococcus patagoniensis]
MDIPGLSMVFGDIEVEKMNTQNLFMFSGDIGFKNMNNPQLFMFCGVAAQSRLQKFHATKKLT